MYRHPDLTQDEIHAITDMFDYAKQQGWLGANSNGNADTNANANNKGRK